MIGFISALRQERQAVRDAWGLHPAGTIQAFELDAGDGCAHLCTGMGAERVVRGASLLVRVYRPSLLVLLGYSVGLQTTQKVGDLLIDSRSDKGLRKHFRASPDPVQEGLIATSGFLQTSAQKRAFAEKHSHSTVADLESEAFIRALGDQVPILVLRVVSDLVTEDLPLFFEELTDEKGFPDVKAIAVKVTTRPALLAPMLALGRDSKKATKSMQRFLLESEELLRDFASRSL